MNDGLEGEPGFSWRHRCHAKRMMTADGPGLVVSIYHLLGLLRD